MIRSLPLVFLLCCLIRPAYAQYPKEFPADQAAWKKAYSEFLKTCTREDCRDLSEKFDRSFSASKASAYVFKIQNITQTMLVKKAPAYPAFFNFTTLLFAIDSAKTSQANLEKNFDILQSLISKCTPGNIKPFLTYVEYLTHLYRNNALYYSNTRQWTADVDYTVDYVDDKPVFTFKDAKLTGRTTSDTLAIDRTTGKYYPLEDLWVGIKGQLDLDRSGFDEKAELNRAKFGAHTINLEKAEFTIDSVRFTFKPYLPDTLVGTYTDKLMQTKSQNILYPKFRSYDDRIVFSTIGKEVKLTGGFLLEGRSVFCVGSDTLAAQLGLFNKEGREAINVEAPRFQLKNFEEVQVEDAFLRVNLKDNSIVHPYVNFSYSSKTKNIKAYRDIKPLSKQPFSSDYHKLFIYADELRWNLDSLNMKFSMISISDDRPAIFESYNYYQEGLENKYKGTYEVGPIEKIYRFADSDGGRMLDAISLALEINPGAPYSATEQIFYKLTEDGYISYNPGTKTIMVKEKLVNQALASKKKQDYDYIKFASFKKYGNALLNTKTNKLEIYGVEEINLSNKSQVKYIPSSDTVVIDSNRTMTVSGRIIAGKVDFYAKKMDFDYDNYAFHMNNVDSMVIYVPDWENRPKESNTVTLIRTKTPLQNITGTLHIAPADNKSGNRNDIRYPYFSSLDTANVYYDKGANKERYPKDKFYYQVYPFELDSLTVTNTENLDLNGRLQSGGIFQPIESNLKLQGDNSLGIEVNTGEAGYNLFGNKGKYVADLRLTNDGLSGKGVFEFGPAKAYADTSFFYLDSVFSKLDSMRITEDKKANLPQASIDGATFTWDVKKDSLTFLPADKGKFDMYNNSLAFDGRLVLNKSNLEGIGTIDWGKTQLTSENISFKARKFEAKNGQLNLSNEEGVSLLKSQDVNAKFDLDQLVADIELNKNDTIPLESFKYVANPKYLNYDLKNKKLTLKSTTPASKFFLLSTDPSKDSLIFYTSAAELDLNNNTIYFGGISELLLADSRVIPDKNEIFIEPDGSIRPLKNATVILNADSAYHTITKAEVNVISRNDFKASGDYIFKTSDGITQIVPVPEIAVVNPYKGQVAPAGKKTKAPEQERSKIYTYGKAVIEEEANFKLNEKVFYKGRFDFDSKHKDIFIDGDVKVVLSSTATDWISMKQQLDPKKPAVSMDSVMNQANNSLFTGLMLDKYNVELYPTILQDKRDARDAAVFSVKGNMIFSKTEPGTIFFGDDNAFRNPYAHSSCLKYNEQSKQMDVTGEIGMGLKLGAVKATTVGNFSFSPGSQNLVLNADFAMKFQMPAEIAGTIIGAFVLADSSSVFSNYKRNKPIQKLFSVLTKDTLEANYLVAKMYINDSMFIPRSMDYNLVITGTRFFWDAQDASFKSVERVSLAIFGGDIIKRQYDAYVEMGYSGETDFVNIYLQNKGGGWLYMKFRRGQMGIASSVPDVYNTLVTLKDADRIYYEGKDPVFEYMPADLSMRDNFVIRVEDFKERFKEALAKPKTP